MKPQQFVLGLAGYVALALSAQAQVTTLDWQFTYPGNPQVPTSSSTTNAAGATFTTGNNKWWDTGPNGVFGTPTGLYSMDPSGGVAPVLELKLDQTPVDKVDLTLVLTHFVDNAQFSGVVDFLPVHSTTFDYVGRTTVVPQTGDMIGAWVADTWTWTGVTYPIFGSPNGAPLTLDLFPGGTSSLMLDEVKLSILGAVSTVPEPVAGQLAGLGLLLFGLRSWLRRKG